jgi:hypothetical protein
VTHTVTLLADHKGFTKPKALGDEYSVIAAIDLTGARPAATGTISITVSKLTDTIVTAASGITTLLAGQEVIIDSANSSNDITAIIDSITVSSANAANREIRLKKDGTDLLLANETGANATITPTSELINAVDLGLSSISSVQILGQESSLHRITPVVSRAGAYGAVDKFELKAVVASSGALVSANTDCGVVRVKVTGNL